MSAAVIAAIPLASSCTVAFLQRALGGILSTTVTVCEQVAVLPLPSVTFHFTAFAPNTKLDGDATTLATLQLSEPVGAVNCELA